MFEDFRIMLIYPFRTGFTKMQNGKRNGMEKGMNQKTIWKLRRKTNLLISLIQQLTKENDLK